MRHHDLGNLFIYLFIYFYSVICFYSSDFIPHLVYPLTVPHLTLSPPSSLGRCFHPTPTLPDLPGAPSLSTVSAPSLTESRPSSPRLYMCWKPYTSWYMLHGWWLTVWKLLEFQVKWEFWSSYGVALFLNFIQLSPKSISRFSSYCQLVGYKYLDLFQLHIGPFKESHDRPICKHTIESGLGLPTWTGSQFGPVTGPHFPQTLLYFYSCSSFRHEQFWVRVFDCEMATPSLQLMPYLFLLEVDSTSSISHCRALHRRSFPLSPKNFSPPRSLFQVFWGISRLIFRVVISVCNLISNGGVLSFLRILTSMCCHLNFWPYTILTGVRWNLMVVLICTSLMNNEFKRFLKCFSAII
jgi:hypothetical protein